MTVTFPPEMLPAPTEGDEAEVIVVHPDTGMPTVILAAPGDTKPQPTDAGSLYVPSRAGRSIQ